MHVNGHVVDGVVVVCVGDARRRVATKSFPTAHLRWGLGVHVAGPPLPATAAQMRAGGGPLRSSWKTFEKWVKKVKFLLRVLENPALSTFAICTIVFFLFAGLAPLVLQGNCPQCTPQETKQIRKVLAYVQTNFPKEFNKILLQYSG